MLELTGELSDGAFLTAPLGFLDFALDRIKVGAGKAGKNLSDIDIANFLPFAMMEDTEKAREMVKTDVCFMVADTPDLVHEKIGLEQEGVDAVRTALRAGIPEAMEKVTPRMVDALAISGTPEECEKRIGEFINAGVTQVVLSSPFGDNPIDVIRRVGKITIPKFR